MWPVVIIVGPPGRDDFAGVTERAEQVLVEALVPEPPDEASANAFCIGLAGAM